MPSPNQVLSATSGPGELQVGHLSTTGARGHRRLKPLYDVKLPLLDFSQSPWTCKYSKAAKHLRHTLRQVILTLARL